MPEDLPPKGPTAESCPRCGAPLHRTTTGLICFRCLGERALQFDDETAPAPPAAAAVPARAAGPAIEKLGGYELLDEIGRGGMGVVYTARQAGLDRVVALKVIADGRLATADHEMRFMREAQTAARLRHRHILTVHDAGRADGHAFYTMDYVESGDLARRLRAGPVAFRTAAEIVAACAEAIAFAHTQGVLHRDLKPSNILLDAGEPRIADFGLASSLAEGEELTVQSRVLGTPHYLAPEIVADGTRAATPASDVFSLGAILYELVAGRPPLGGATSAQVLQLAGKQEAPALRLLSPAVPRDLETIAAKSLENDPARRYADAGALAADLRRFLAGELILARPVGGAERFARWCRRRPALAGVWFLVAAIAVGSTFAAVRIQRERRRAEAGEDRAVAAERAALEQLARAKLEQARALKVTGRDGRRFAALGAIREAARVQPTLELRNEAAALLTLLDARVVRQWRMQGQRDTPHAFSADAGTYVVELGPGEFAVRRLDDDRELARLKGLPGSMVGTPRFSARGRWLAARGDDDRLRVWDAAAGGEPRLVLDARPLPVSPVSQDFAFDFDFSPDEERFAAGLAGGGVSVHRLREPSPAADAWPSPGAPNIVRFSPDGATLAVASPAAKAIRLLDAATGAERRSIALATPPVAADWSRDGAALAATLRLDRTVVFDATTGEMRATLRTPDTISTQVLFLGNPRWLLLGGTDRGAVLWDWIRERPVLRIADWGANPVLGATRDDRRLVSSQWSADVAGVLELAPSPVWRTAPSAFTGVDRASIGCGGVAVSRDGRLAALANLAGVQVHRLDDLALLGRCEIGARRDGSVAFSPDARWLYVGNAGVGIARCRLEPGEGGAARVGAPEVVLPEEGWRVCGTSPADGRVVLAHHERGLVRVVDFLGSLAKVEWAAEGVWSVAFSPDGNQVLTQTGNIGHTHDGSGPNVWNSRTGALVRALPAGKIGEVSWSAAGPLAVIGARELRIFDRAESGEGRRVWDGVLEGATLVALSPDGTLLAHSTNAGIELARARDGERLVRLKAAEQGAVPFALRFTPDGARIVANSMAGELVVWELAALRAELRALGLDWE